MLYQSYLTVLENSLREDLNRAKMLGIDLYNNEQYLDLLQRDLKPVLKYWANRSFKGLQNFTLWC